MGRRPAVAHGSRRNVMRGGGAAKPAQALHVAPAAPAHLSTRRRLPPCHQATLPAKPVSDGTDPGAGSGVDPGTQAAPAASAPAEDGADARLRTVPLPPGQPMLIAPAPDELKVRWEPPPLRCPSKAAAGGGGGDDGKEGGGSTEGGAEGGEGGGDVVEYEVQYGALFSFGWQSVLSTSVGAGR